MSLTTPSLTKNLTQDKSRTIPPYFSLNLKYVFDGASTGAKIRPTTARRCQHLQSLSANALVAWALEHQPSVWQRIPWEEFTDQVHAVNPGPLWTRKISERLKKLADNELKHSPLFASFRTGESSLVRLHVVSSSSGMRIRQVQYIHRGKRFGGAKQPW